ncbi:hypothetical protein PsYK624_170590 [Phanerochaete sordida]|uniref:Uncharacterized protein n=1 Tax=Phanerochaete sordida TaxID=48140 RepID=A0A9P3GRW5_9APHY|nr:hypothetical protein PsYK624_170590 [Phanerochaete sordida]
MLVACHPDFRAQAALACHRELDHKSYWSLPIARQREVLRHHSLFTLVGLSTVSLASEPLVLDVLRQRWLASLAALTNDVAAMLDVMRRTRAVLSGPRVLAYIDAVDTPHLPWQFIVASQGFDDFCDWLKTHEGARVDNLPSATDVFSSNPSVAGRRLFRTKNGYFDIIQSASTNVLLPIPSYSSTALVNYITADEICVGYPFLALRNLALPAYHLTPRNYPAASAEIERLGYTMAQSANAAYPDYHGRCMPYGVCVRCPRFLGDGFSLMVRFGAVARPLVDVTPSMKVVGQTVAWTWGGNGCGHQHCMTRAKFIAHNSLMVYSST